LPLIKRGLQRLRPHRPGIVIAVLERIEPRRAAPLIGVNDEPKAVLFRKRIPERDKILKLPSGVDMKQRKGRFARIERAQCYTAKLIAESPRTSRRHSGERRGDSLTIDVVLTNSDRQLDASTTLTSRLLKEQPVSLIGRPQLKKKRFRYPVDLRTVPILLPSLESDIRVAFDRELARHGIEPIVLAEVDDMAMLRLLARESDGVTLVPPIVVRDELASGILVEHCLIPNVNEHFYAITQPRRFPNPLLVEVLSQAS
jgi:hypothetical protein